MVAPNPSSFDIWDPQSIDDDNSAFTIGSSSVLGDDLLSENELPMFADLDKDDYGSLNLALDDNCSSSAPTLVNKRHVKVRDASVCTDKNPPVYLPENFQDLSEALQDKIFREFMCPSSQFPHTYYPVCSSPDPDDTQMLGYLTGNAVPIHFTLLHSLPSSYPSPYPPLCSHRTNHVRN